MLVVDADVLIDLRRGHPPARAWFASLPPQEELIVPGFAAMEVLQGCLNKIDQQRAERQLAPFRRVWPDARGCDLAYRWYADYRLSNSLGLLDALIAASALPLGVPLSTFNQKHFNVIPGPATIRPYVR